MKALWTVTRWMLREKRDILLSILFGYTAGLGAVALFAASGYLVSKAGLVPPLYTLTVVVALIKLFGVIRAASRYQERLASHRATFTILSEVRVQFYRRLEPLVPSIFAKYRSGDLLSRVVGDVESLQNYFLRVFYPPLILMLVFLSTIFFVSFFSVWVSVWMLVGLFLTGFVVPLLFAYQRSRQDIKIRASRGELATDLTEMLYGFRDLKLHHELDRVASKLRVQTERYILEQERDARTAASNSALTVAIALLVSWGVLAIGAFQVTNGELDGLFLAMLVMMSLTAFENTTPMAVFPGHFANSKQAAERLEEVVAPGAVLAEEESKRTFHRFEAAPRVSYEGVRYRYPEGRRDVLNDIDIDIEAGANIAIVGPSGSGKSTLLQLLLTFARGYEGSIRVDDVELAKTSQESIWEQASVVLQDNHFFYGTVRENLAIAAEVTDDVYEAVLKQVALPFSLDEHVLEKGENLSGGERQRLAIARALLKNGRLWLLDEATSSLDAKTEAVVLSHVFERAREATLVMISHRLTGLERFDRIIVMEEGRIVETGTFTELMERRGTFFALKQIEHEVLA